MQKPLSEMDSDLIGECVDRLVEIDGQEITIPEAKIKRITKTIIDRYYKPAKKRLLKFFRVTAACVAVIFCVEFISVAVFKEDLFEDIYDGTHYVLHYYILEDLSMDWLR